MATLETQGLLQPRVEILAAFGTDGAAGRAELENRTLATGRLGHAVGDEPVVGVVGGGLLGRLLFDGLGVVDGAVDLAVVQRDELVVVAEHLQQLRDALFAQSDGGDAAFVDGGGDHLHTGVALVSRGEGQVFLGAGLLSGGGGSVGGLDALAAGSAVVGGHLVPALATDGVLDETGDGVDEVLVQHAVGEPRAARDVFAGGEPREHIRLPAGVFDIVDAFDVVLAFERFQTAVEDRLV